MKRLFLIVPLVLVAVFVWLGTMQRPAPTNETEITLPASQILQK